MNCSREAATCHKGCGARKRRFAGIFLLWLFMNMATALALDLPAAVRLSKAYLDAGDQGTGTPPEAAEAAEAAFSYYIASSSYLKMVSYVGVAPSAPPDEKNSRRWSVARVDEYIAAVITEAAQRFTIDPDRVVLAGHSIGGMGAYSLGLRLSDRFSTVLAHSGSWQSACWTITIGTPFFIIHGSHDAVPPG